MQLFRLLLHTQYLQLNLVISYDLLSCHKVVHVMKGFVHETKSAHIILPKRHFYLKCEAQSATAVPTARLVDNEIACDARLLMLLHYAHSLRSVAVVI